jgi:molybdopterin synthase sulfur carrier subunit
MKLQVKLFASLARDVSRAGQVRFPDGFRAGTPLEIELPQESTLADLVDYLGLPREQIKVTFVNGRAQELDHRLEPGDEIGIFPPIGGG